MGNIWGKSNKNNLIQQKKITKREEEIKANKLCKKTRKTKDYLTTIEVYACKKGGNKSNTNLVQQPTLCPNLGLISDSHNMSNKQCIEEFDGKISSEFEKSEMFLRINFGICSTIYKNKVKKLFASEDFKLLFILQTFFIDIYSIEDNKLVQVFLEDVEISNMIVISEKCLIYYVTAQDFKCWDYKDNTIQVIFSFKLVFLNTIAASPNTFYIAVGSSSGALYLIDCENENSVDILKKHESCIRQIKFTQDSQFFISAGGDFDSFFDCYIRVWNAQRKSLIAIFAGHPLPVYSLQIHPNNKVFLSLSGDCTLRLWNLERVIFKCLKTRCPGNFLHPNCKNVEFNSEIHMKISQLLSNHSSLKFPDAKQESLQCYVSDVLESCKEDAEINRINFKNEFYYNSKVQIPAEAYFIENYIVVINLDDCKLIFYDMKTTDKQKILYFKSIPYTNINFIQNKILFADNDARVHIFDCIAKTNQILYTLRRNINQVSFKIDYSRFFMSIFYNFEDHQYYITIWDLIEMKFLGQIFLGKNVLNNFIISENGQFLYVSTNDNIKKLFNIQTKTLIKKFVLKGVCIVNSGFTNDSKYFIALNIFGGCWSIKVWKTSGVQFELTMQLVNISNSFPYERFFIKIKDDIYLVNQKCEILNKGCKKKWDELKREDFCLIYRRCNVPGESNGKQWCNSKKYGVCSKDKKYYIYDLKSRVDIAYLG